MHNTFLHLSISGKWDVKCTTNPGTYMSDSELKQTSLYKALYSKLEIIGHDIELIYIEWPPEAHILKCMTIARIIRLLSKGFPQIVCIFPIHPGCTPMSQDWLSKYKAKWIGQARIANMTCNTIGVAFYTHFGWTLNYSCPVTGFKKNCQEQTYSNKPLYTNKGQYTEEYGLRLTNKLKELTEYLYPYRVNYDSYRKYCLPQSQ